MITEPDGKTVNALRAAHAREWEASDWITSSHPKWRGREQQIVAVCRHGLDVVDYRPGGMYRRILRTLPADVRLTRKGASDAA